MQGGEAELPADVVEPTCQERALAHPLLGRIALKSNKFMFYSRIFTVFVHHYHTNFIYDRKENFVCVRSAHGSRAGRVEALMALTSTGISPLTATSRSAC